MAVERVCWAPAGVWAWGICRQNVVAQDRSQFRHIMPPNKDCGGSCATWAFSMTELKMPLPKPASSSANYAEATGVFEAYVELGDTVEVGMPAGAIHFTETPWCEPHPVFFSHGGTVLCKRRPARAKIGDCLFVTGTAVDVH